MDGTRCAAARISTRANDGDAMARSRYYHDPDPFIVMAEAIDIDVQENV